MRRYSEGAKISVCLVMSLCNGGDLFQQLERLHKVSKMFFLFGVYGCK